MANTMSAKKAVRQAARNASHNLFWRNRIRGVVKNIKGQLVSSAPDVAIIKKEHSLFYKVVDKAVKKGVIHKNKARRLKSKISKEIAKYENPAKSAQNKKAPTRSTKRASSKNSRKSAK